MGIAVITSSAPTSMNARRGRYNAKLAHKRKKLLEGELAMALLEQNVPRPIPGDRVHATAELLFPTARRRDAGNFRAGLEKALGDALSPHDPDSPHRWLSDDTPKQFTFGDVTFGLTPIRWDGKRGPAQARITLVWALDLVELLQAEARRLSGLPQTAPARDLEQALRDG